jgi:hypothetical protein
LPEVDFTPCEQRGTCGPDVADVADAYDATTNDLVEATTPDGPDDARSEAGAADVLGDAGGASDAASDVAAAMDSAEVALDAAPDVVACEAGAALVDGGCATVNAPRLVAPLSTSTVSSQTPRLRWELAGATDGARIELCRERACATVVQRFEATGSTTVTPMTLAPGVWFWRATGVRGGVVGTTYGPTWQFVVGHRSATVNTAWGSATDFNGDGYADLVVADRRTVLVYSGGPTWGRTPPTVIGLAAPSGSLDFVSSLRSGGDLNGDGYPELLVSISYISATSRRSRATLVFEGSRGGLLLASSHVYDQVASSAEPIGDFDLDGRGDLALDVMIARGLADRWPEDTRVTRPLSGVAAGAALGDINGDGFADVALSELMLRDAGVTLVANIFNGNAAALTDRLAATLVGGAVVAALGDVDGDGYSDFAGPGGSGAATVLYRGGLGMLVGTSALPTGSLTPAGDLDADGYDDVLLVDDASAALLLGARSVPLSARRTLIAPGGVTLPRGLVRAAASIGDIDGDGTAELAIATASEQVHIYSGAASVTSGLPVRTIAGAPSSGFGLAIAR